MRNSKTKIISCIYRPYLIQFMVHHNSCNRSFRIFFGNRISASQESYTMPLYPLLQAFNCIMINNKVQNNF